MLTIANLSKKFGNRWALRNLNLELDSGEIFVLLGPNGAGKTTTLKLIAGLLHPTAGTMKICGYDPSREPLKAKGHIGFVPDEPFIYGKLTGREFLHLVASIFRVPKNDLSPRLSRLFELLEIDGWIDQPAETYSHGMKQKVVICQLLIHDPALILVDEPLVGLDPKISIVVRRIFSDLREQGRCLLVSTHTLSFARDIATRIGIINRGELKFVGDFAALAKISGSVDIEEIYLRLSR